MGRTSLRNRLSHDFCESGKIVSGRGPCTDSLRLPGRIGTRRPDLCPANVKQNQHVGPLMPSLF